MTKNGKDIGSAEAKFLKQLLKEQTAELELARERLFHANQVKSEFLSHVSRELRTPLNNITDYANLILDDISGTGGRKQRERLKHIIENSGRLRSMVERILELCTVDIGMTRFLPERLYLPDSLKKIVHDIRSSARRKGIAVTVRYRDDIGPINVDESKFKFIMEELLTNALKFSKRDSRITVSVRKVKISDDTTGEFAEISVTDQGMGIRREDIDRIFSGFEQVDTAHLQSGSLGLGLSLVKRFVELHGGKIWVDSYPGEGSTFTFILPKEGILPPESATPRIMAAIANPSLAQMLAHYLRKEGYEIGTADNGLEVLNRGLASPPDLFLIEQELPEMQGSDVCLQLKSRKNVKHVPVIIVSVHPERKKTMKISRIGADAYYSHPFEIHELLDKIRNLISQKLNHDYLRKSYEIAATQACTDPMTGLYNPRYLWHTLDRELERAGRYGRLCSVMMIDIDFFKQYNDMHGHLQGDEVLKKSAEIFRRNLRNTDIIARYGGEEFLVIMPETGKELAFLVGEKLRKSFENYPFPLEESQPDGRLTISIGLATFPGDSDNAKILVDKADKALYRAKEGGRNRVIAWEG
jgi:diguanylate cyclase (GGDEF)-like protein